MTKKSIERFTDEELREEIARRSLIIPQPPAPKIDPDFRPLVKCITDGVKEMIKEGYENDNFSHYVYEIAITCVYGEDYWPWRNSLRF